MNIKEKYKKLVQEINGGGEENLTVTELKQKRASLLDDNGEIFREAEIKGRDLTPDEVTFIETSQREIDNLTNRIKLQEMELKQEAYQESSNDRVIKEFGDGVAKPRSNKGVEHWRSMSGDREGKKIPVLSGNANLKDHVPADDYKGSVEDYLIDRARGFTGGTRTMDTSADSSMVPVGISTQIVDEARSLSSIFRAGARTFPMSSKTETIARITDSATPQWKAENAPHSASDIKTEPLTFTAATLVASVKSSVELAEDANNLAQVVRQNLTQQLALELDRVALLGTGKNNEPTGVLNQDGVLTVDMGNDGAALQSYAPFSQAYENILAANGNPNAAIFSPRTWGTIDRLTDQQDQPLNPPMSFQNLLKLPTSQVPNDMTHGTAENASAAFVGSFSQLVVGVRTNLTLEVTRVGSDSDTSAWPNLQLWWRAYLRADVQLLHPNHFCTVEGIIPASS